MKYITYSLYGLWAVVAILLKILAGASWWLATSFIWFPLLVVIVLLVGLQLSLDIGRIMQIRKAEKEEKEKSCENCLFNWGAKYANDDKCLGEKMDENHHRPKVCPYHKTRNQF